MIESIYEKALSRLTFFQKTYEDFAFNKISFPDEYLINNNINHLLLDIEFREIVKQFQERSEGLLFSLYNRYLWLQSDILNNIILNTELPNTTFTLNFSCLIDIIVRQLKEILIEEPIFQNVPKSINNGINTTESILGNDIEPENVIALNNELKKWILPDYISKYEEIEKELFKRGYVEKSLKWKKYKTELVMFSCIIDKYRFFKPMKMNGKKIKDFHKRQFISQRYGFKKTGLTETWKNIKPNLEEALATFFWITKPD